MNISEKMSQVIKTNYWTLKNKNIIIKNVLDSVKAMLRV